MFHESVSGSATAPESTRLTAKKNISWFNIFRFDDDVSSCLERTCQRDARDADAAGGLSQKIHKINRSGLRKTHSSIVRALMLLDDE